MMGAETIFGHLGSCQCIRVTYSATHLDRRKCLVVNLVMEHKLILKSFFILINMDRINQMQAAYYMTKIVGKIIENFEPGRNL